MKIRLDRKLKPFVNAELAAAMASDPEANRKKLRAEIVASFVRTGNAERFISKEGVAYRCTHAMLERLAEEDVEAKYEDSELDD